MKVRGSANTSKYMHDEQMKTNNIPTGADILRLRKTRIKLIGKKKKFNVNEICKISGGKSVSSRMHACLPASRTRRNSPPLENDQPSDDTATS